MIIFYGWRCCYNLGKDQISKPTMKSQARRCRQKYRRVARQRQADRRRMGRKTPRWSSDPAWQDNPEILRLFYQVIYPRLHSADGDDIIANCSNLQSDILDMLRPLLKVAHLLLSGRLLYDKSCILKNRFGSLFGEFSTADLTCDCHNVILTSYLISNPLDLILIADFIKLYWPDRADQSGLVSFYHMISYSVERECRKNNEYRPINGFRFTEGFIRSVVDVDVRFREPVVARIVQRIGLSVQEAAASGQLHDEEIRQASCRRFRVTQRPTSTRIHYDFQDGALRFLQYYTAGQHDSGLRR